MSTWWYVADGEQKGPFSDDEFCRLLTERTVRADSLVWKPGTEGWQPAREIPEIAQILASIPPEIPPAKARTSLNPQPEANPDPKPKTIKRGLLVMPNKAPRRMGFRMILLAMCALLIVVVASLAPPRPQSTTTDRLKPDDLSLTLAACNKAQDAVKTALKAPATAQFPSCAWSMSQYEVRGSPDRTAFSVTGHVDAQNSFGAMLREQFVVKLTKVGSDPYTGWTVTGVALQ